ncbi:MAG: bifunctional folylpolyglutamate synthase/dihydrofolate synthase, partial [Moraxella sp.]|nr:bifunctional folylpolyglutamate synthase/dihydrofolate synthase [Moraxella sp.]
NQQAIRDGLAAVKLAGRFDVRMIDERLWVFDVAHNKAGVSFLMSQFIAFWRINHSRQLHVVFSMLADKDIDGVLSVFCEYHLPVKTWHIAPLDNSRSMTAEAIFHKLSSVVDSKIYSHQDIAQATKRFI